MQKDLVFAGFCFLVLALHILSFWVDVVLPKFVERLFQDIRARVESVEHLDAATTWPLPSVP